MDGITQERQAIDRQWDREGEVATARRQPEVMAGLEWLDNEVDKLHALLSQAEDALSLLLPQGQDRAMSGEARQSTQTQLGATVHSLAERMNAANARLADLLDRVRVAL